MLSNSKYKAQITVARNLVNQFGSESVRLRRVQKAKRSGPPRLGGPATRETNLPYLYSIVVLPEGTSGLLQSQDAVFGRKRCFIVLQTDPVPELEDYSYVKVGDEFDLTGKSYQIAELSPLNPDSEFPILWECIIE